MTPLFPGWNLLTLRKKPKSNIQKLIVAKRKIEQRNFSQLSSYLEKIIPPSLINPLNERDFSRRRVFSLENTFWGFFQQILSADGGCKEIVNQFRLIADQKGLGRVSASSSAYCQSRKCYLMSCFQRSYCILRSLSKTRRQKPLSSIGELLLSMEQAYQCMTQLQIRQHGHNQGAKK